MSCNYCKPFHDRSIPGLKGAIKAGASFTNDPEPMYVVSVEHWEEVGGSKSVKLRKVISEVELPVSFCPKCGRDLREGGGDDPNDR